MTLEKTYDNDFKPGANYKATLPDLQNTDGFKGAKVFLPIVGIHNFKMPIKFYRPDGEPMVLETSITGSVSLDAEKKGINMSRIIRSFYDVVAENGYTYALELANKVVGRYQDDLGENEARVLLSFHYPVWVESLRTGLAGWQYYDIALEVAHIRGRRVNIMHLDYVYSSTCPCSLELSEHARDQRGRMATPHSQRSVARISVRLNPNAEEPMRFEELIEACREAVPTETQVMVKREDEQAFAELNGSNPIFVEDATRLLAQSIQALTLDDFRVICSHQESLHSHDAIAMYCEGEFFDAHSIDPYLFKTLIKR